MNQKRKSRNEGKKWRKMRRIYHERVEDHEQKMVLVTRLENNYSKHSIA